MSKSVKSSKIGGMVIKDFPGYFLMACLILSFIFLFKVFESFIVVLLFAAILATALHPLYDKIFIMVKSRAKLASILTCLFVLLIIVVPMVVFVLLLGKQAFDTYIFVREQVLAGVLDPYLKWEPGGILYDLVGLLGNQFGSLVDFSSIDVKGSIIDAARNIAVFLAGQSASLLKEFGLFLFSIFVMFFALYYFFKDAHSIREKIMVVSPLPTKYENELIKKFREISLATLYGIFLTSIAQGILGGIGFAIAGIPNVLFWGTAIAVFSLVPLIGTATIWLPAGIILLVGGNIFGGIFLLAWGVLIVSTVDNFLRAYLIGGKTNTNQLLTFLAVFGGIGLFGLIGVILGPLILNLFFTFLHIYEMEYNRLLHDGDLDKLEVQDME
ncbi:AI-2E family transporter [Candidatus Peregrinibacteria bacterium]|nr:AI-2E family transporter [Candidatus Peregrinibacteria bacterium]